MREGELFGLAPIRELAGYLGHADPAFTLRVYAHLLRSPHDRCQSEGLIDLRLVCTTTL